MNTDYIAYCGLDCEKCEARLATINNDDVLRRKVAQKWSEMNNAEILPEMINCEGCKTQGIKTYFCERLCEIRRCAVARGMRSCGHCEKVNGCKTVEMITKYSQEAADNLKRI